MKTFLVVVLLLHGLIHLIGFVKPVQSLSEETTSGSFSFISRIAWFIGFLLLLLTAFVYYQGKTSWWIAGLAAVILSQVLIIISWKEARWGSVPNLLLLLAVIAGFAYWKFDRENQQIADNIISSAQKSTEIVRLNDLQMLPPAVQKWLMRSGVVGKPKAAWVRLEQSGLIKQKKEKDKWIPAHSIQYFSTDPPAFIWTVKMEMAPGIIVNGRDLFLGGRGNMLVRAFSMVNLANETGPKTDQGALQRYLAEICWFPSAALNSNIKWEQLDLYSARATLTYGGTEGSVNFYFSPEGDLKKCVADRYMGGGKEAKLEKWEVVNTAWGKFQGLRVPVKSEATWKLKDGDFTWFKLEIIDIKYDPLKADTEQAP